MKNRSLFWLSISLLLGVGIIHLYIFPAEMEEATYLGLLFIVNFLGALVAAYGMIRGKAWGWGLGMLVSAGSLGAYIVSRTVGLPGSEVEDWLNGQGLLSLVVEGGYILLGGYWLVKAGWLRKLMHMVRQPQSVDPQAAGPFDRSVRGWAFSLAPAVLVLALIMVGLVTLPGHQHNDEELYRNPVLISQQALEEEYGVKVFLVGTTNLGGTIDFRLRILDEKKAAVLLDDHAHMPALLMGDNHSEIIFPSHMGHHGHVIKQDGIYFLLFPNLNRELTPGMPLSIAFGNLLLEPIMIQ